MYDLIYELVKLTDCTDRALWIMEQLPNAVVQSAENVNNIIAEGTDKRILYIAHYDIINQFNANDNSASVINLLAFKKLFPFKSIALTDKEEPPFYGKGARLLCDYIRENNIRQVINLELTGYGSNLLYDEILDPINRGEPCHFAFSDSNIIKSTMPEIKANTIILFNTDKTIIHNCHTARDTVDKINLKDMQYFTEHMLSNIGFSD
jgi:hypothetical protein